MRFEITILGSNSAIPTANRNPSGQLLNVNEHFYLIDCGEGTQMQLRRNNIKFQRISHIFISHLHGDHFFGLIGLLMTMELLGRKKTLTIHAHEPLQEIINVQLKATKGRFSFPIIYQILPKENALILSDNNIEVRTVKLNHRIPCCGFIFKEKKRPLNLKKEVINSFQIPISAIKDIKSGEDFINADGVKIANNLLTERRHQQRSYAYCTDTKYKESIVPNIENVDLLYHEATFTEEHLKRAKATYHSTAKQAGLIAHKANVEKLILGHFSVRYKTLIPLLNEAKEVFPNTQLAEEGIVFAIAPKTM